jgi:hypothetical protein
MSQSSVAGSVLGIVNEFGGATSGSAGTPGSVPAPPALGSGAAKALLSDKTWGDVASSDTIQTLTATGVVTAWGSVVLADATLGNMTVTLPAASGSVGKTIKVVKVDASSNTVTVAENGGNTMSSLIPLVLGQQNQVLVAEAKTSSAVQVVGNLANAVLAEYGSQSVTAQTFSTNTFADSSGVYTLPSAGIWALRYDIASDGSGANTNSHFAITTSANVVVAGSEKARGGGVTTAQILSAEVIVTTTGAATYKLRGRNGGSGSASILNATANDSTITWQKISGFAPVEGQTIDYVNASRSTDISVAANAVVPFNVVEAGNIPMSAGVFTLTAGKTYKLEGSVRIVPSSATESFSFQWRDITNNVLIGNSGITRNGAAGAASNSQQSIAVAVITPVTNITVRMENVAATESMDAGSSYAYIQQLGSSAVGTTTIAEWADYTPTITSHGGAALTKATVNTEKASYKIVGKTMHLKYMYYAASATGATAGTAGIPYAWSIPAGYTIDTATALIPTVISSASRAGIDGTPLGGADVSATGGVTSTARVVPLSTTTVGIYDTIDFSLVRNGRFTFNSANASYAFTAEIPIL